MFSFLKKKKVLATHNGGFHSDDIFASATLQIYLEKIGEDFEIVRTRDEKIIKEADFVFDVGGIYDPNSNRFDHHQKGGAGVRENGVPFAAFGLVWKKFGAEICGDFEVAKEIDRALAQPVDANDNGMNVYISQIENVSPITFQDITGLYYPNEDASEVEYFRAFNELVLLAKRILQKCIIKTKKQFEINLYLKNLYEKSEDKRLAVVENPYERFSLAVASLNLPELLYVVYPSTDMKIWKILATRIGLQNMESKKPFPENWRGLRDEELQKVTGISSASFCHNSGFYCVAEKRQDAVELAKLSINS
ncbi:MAG: MYG1 family protein [Candidatus Paceibacterota bacterium]